MAEKLPIIDPIMDFRIGETYSNDFIAEQLVISKQGGIRVSTTHDHVVLFTNPSGEREAIYEDQPLKDDFEVINYTGQGQIGDQVLEGNNKSLVQAPRNGRTIQYFYRQDRNEWEYLGQYRCQGYSWGKQKDQIGNVRRVVLFHLLREGKPYRPEYFTLHLGELMKTNPKAETLLVESFFESSDNLGEFLVPINLPMVFGVKKRLPRIQQDLARVNRQLRRGELSSLLVFLMGKEGVSTGLELEIEGIVEEEMEEANDFNFIEIEGKPLENEVFPSLVVSDPRFVAMPRLNSMSHYYELNMISDFSDIPHPVVPIRVLPTPEAVETLVISESARILQASLHRELTASELFDKETKYHLTKLTYRQRGFREAVIQQYQGKCVVCGKKRQSPPPHKYECEAAHIIPKAKKGSDKVQNGIALCRLHHWAFDVGWISYDSNRKLIVSPLLERVDMYEEIYKYEGTPLPDPIDPRCKASDYALEFHRNNVFYQGGSLQFLK